MKKVLIIAALIGVGYYAFGKKKDVAPTSDSPILPGNEIDSLDYSKPENLFSDFSNKIVIDVNGYWTVVENGKLRPADNNDLSKFPPSVNVEFDLWKYYTSNHPSLIAKW